MEGADCGVCGRDMLGQTVSVSLRAAATGRSDRRQCMAEIQRQCSDLHKIYKDSRIRQHGGAIFLNYTNVYEY